MFPAEAAAGGGKATLAPLERPCLTLGLGSGGGERSFWLYDRGQNNDF